MTSTRPSEPPNGSDSSEMDKDKRDPIDPRLGSCLGDYLIESQIGRGGMGVVYRARHVPTGDQVALKLMSPDLADNASFRERFILEAEAGPMVAHPNVVEVFESGEVDGELFIAMALVEGTDLKKLIQEEGPLDTKRALSILGQVAAALDAAHESGVVHRDVKPQNILVAPGAEGGKDKVYLSDFGLLQPTSSESSISRTDQVFGSVGYIAPELIEGVPADGRADVYALGCVLYECLTGKIPFERANEIATVWGHIHEDPPLLTAERRDLPAGVDDAILKAMAKHPDDRFLTAGELIESFEEGLGRRRSRLRYANQRPLIARISRGKTEREVWSPNFFPELSRVRYATRERLDWRKVAAFGTAFLLLSSVQFGREGGLPRAVRDVAGAANSIGSAILEPIVGEKPEDPQKVARAEKVGPLDKQRVGALPGARSSRKGKTEKGGSKSGEAGGPSAPSASELKPLIAFSSNLDGDYDIYVVSPDGSGRTKLTDTDEDEWDPEWSPDGQWLAFLQGDFSGNTSDVFVIRWDGQRMRRLTSTTAYESNPSWLSASRILFNKGTGSYSIRSSGGREKLFREMTIDPDYCEGRKSLAYLRYTSGLVQDLRIWVAHADGSDAPLHDEIDQRNERAPALSPDCSSVVFWAVDDTFFSEVFVTDMDGSTVRIADGFDPDWSPDGRWIVFNTNDLRLIRPDGTEGRIILRAGPTEDLRMPTWRPLSRPLRA